MIRRDVLRLGGVFVAGLAMADKVGAVLPSPRPIALFDGRYSDARAFAAAVRKAGGAPFDTKGDLATLWHGVRRDRGTHRPVAGLTTYADMLIMADIAGGERLRPIFRIMHDARHGGHVAHRILEGAGGPILEGSGRLWPEMVSVYAAGLPGRGLDRGPSPRSPDHPGTLWSWMFG